MSERYWQEVRKCEACKGTGVYNSYTDYGDEPCPKCKYGDGPSGYIAVGKPKPDHVVWALLDAVPPPEMP